MQDLYSFFNFEPGASSILYPLNNDIKRVKNPQFSKEVNFIKHQAVWEYRVFWPCDADPISLESLFTSLPSFDNFHSSILDDIYILIDHKPLNLKIRQGKLVYKPVFEQEQGILACGQKIKFSFPLKWSKIYPLFPRLEFSTKFCPDLSCFLTHLHDCGYFAQLISFQKKVYRCKLGSTLQLEISQFDIKNQRWFSLCVESKNYNLIKQEKLKNNKGFVMGYVEFLEKYGRP